jgi:hypothetical protein
LPDLPELVQWLGDHASPAQSPDPDEPPFPDFPELPQEDDAHSSSSRSTSLDAWNEKEYVFVSVNNDQECQRRNTQPLIIK